MEIKDYFLNDEGKVTHILWENGKKTPIPYYVEHSLSDFDGDRMRYREFVDGLTMDYEQEKIGTLPDEPVRSMFPSEDVYQSRKRMWEQEKVQEKIIERHKPPAPPPPYRDKFGFTGLPSDENMAKRVDLYGQIHAWEGKLETARGMSDTNAIDRARYFIKHLQKDVEAIPESKFQTIIRQGAEQEVRDIVGVLFDPKTDKNDPKWGIAILRILENIC